MQGLVIRYFSSGYFLCDGLPPEGHYEQNGDFHIGNTVRWFETWRAANEMREMIERAYGISIDRAEETRANA